VLPVPGQEFGKPGGWMIIDSAEHVGKPSPWIDIVQLGGLDQGEHRSGTFPTPIGAGE
jgi:hypothetical protein